MAFLIPSIQFFFGLPRAVFCFGIHLNAILGNLPSAILWTWPYHVSWFCSISFIIVSSNPICLSTALIYGYQILFPFWFPMFAACVFFWRSAELICVLAAMNYGIFQSMLDTSVADILMWKLMICFLVIDYNCRHTHISYSQHFLIKALYSYMIGVGGLGVACWPLVPKFAGSNPAEAVGFLGRKNPQYAFLRRGK